ncbi:MAG: nucleotide exchange factor GrpE [Planctomycetota bacterium]|jgi:molecular chaperone GrpE
MKREKEREPAADEVRVEESPSEELPAAGEEASADDASSGGASGADSEEQIGFYVDRLQRMQAEFENFRRRSQQELREREARTTVRIFQSILPVVDDLRLAARTEEQGSEGANEGLRIILDKLSGLLGELSIEEIPAEGEPFDPQWHEALLHQESDDVDPGCIVQELERGYRLGETLIRASRVIVSKGKES